VCEFIAYVECKYVGNVVISELLIVCYAERNGLVVFRVTVLHLPTGTDKKHEKSE
jgi:hypothetical protein